MKHLFAALSLFSISMMGVDAEANRSQQQSSGNVKIDSLTPENQKYLNSFCNFHPTSGLCHFTPNPVAKPPYTPPAKPMPDEPIPGVPGPSGPGIPPVPFAGCGQQANLCYPMTGRSVAVSGSGQLQAALNNAQPGDHITLASGNYGGSFNYNKNGQPGKPIVIKAANGANVVFTGSFNMNGSYGVLTRVRFQGGKMTMNGHHNRVTRVAFGNAGGGEIIGMKSGGHKCNRVDHNEFKSFTGMAIEISAQHNAANHQGHRIDHNLFYDHRVGGSEEVVRMLTDAYRDSYITYDYNLFDKVLQGPRNQAETISVKTARTTLIGNTITNSGNAGISLRVSNRSLVQNNYFDGGAQLKVLGDDHVIKGNTVAGGGSIQIRGGNGTMDTKNASCGKKASIAPTLTNCKGVHAASRRTKVMDNIGKITVGDLYKGNTFKATDTVLTNNSGPVILMSGQANTKNTPGKPQPAARKLSQKDVGFSVGDASCSGN